MKRTLFLSVTALAMVTAACGGDDATSAGSGRVHARTVEVTMRDIAYAPTSLEVDAGETIRFVFTNDGDVDHDAFIGDTSAQADHETEMRDAEDDAHGGGHDDADNESSTTVEPGDTGELTHTFDEPGEIEIGCHEPGHYEAGMKIDIIVT